MFTDVQELSFEDTFVISPNPISSTSVIEYTLQQSSHVTIQVLNVSGQVVISLIDEQQQEKQQILFDGSQLKPGVYICVLKNQ